MDYRKNNQLETKRLILRQFDIDKDLQAYSKIMGENNVGKWLPKNRGYTEEETENFMSYIIKHWKDKDYGIWAVTDKNNGTLLGHCGLNFVNNLNEIEVLYALGENARGFGYGTEAANETLKYGFYEKGFSKIIALAKPGNQPSIRVMEKLGLNYLQDVELFNQRILCYQIKIRDYKSNHFKSLEGRDV